MDSLVTPSAIRGYHVYQTIWIPEIGEKLTTKRERLNEHDRFAGQRFAHAHWHSAHLAIYYGTSSSVAESPSAFHHAYLLGVQAILSIPLGPKEVIDKVVVIREPPSPLKIYPARTDTDLGRPKHEHVVPPMTVRTSQAVHDVA